MQKTNLKYMNHLIDIAMRNVGRACKPVKGYHCGGTHVQNTGDFKAVIVEKVKNKKGFLRVSYSVE